MNYCIHIQRFTFSLMMNEYGITYLFFNEFLKTTRNKEENEWTNKYEKKNTITKQNTPSQISNLI